MGRADAQQEQVPPATDREYQPVPVSRSVVVLLTVFHCVWFLSTGWVLHALDSSLPVALVWVVCYCTEVLALAVHWAGHRNWSGWWNRAHMGHHLNDYPRHRFLSPAYQPAKKDNSVAYYPVILLAPLLAMWLMGDFRWHVYGIGLLCSAGLLKVADELHMAFHTRHHWLERFGIFEQLRAMHYFHHRGTMKQNYAIADFFLDWLLLGINFA